MISITFSVQKYKTLRGAGHAPADALRIARRAYRCNLIRAQHR